MGKKHGGLIKNIVDCINMTGLAYVWATQNGTFRTMDYRRVVSVGKKGSADITGLIRKTGQRIEIECKVGKDKQRPEQKQFEQLITDYGGAYKICTNLDDALDFIFNCNRDKGC